MKPTPFLLVFLAISWFSGLCMAAPRVVAVWDEPLDSVSPTVGMVREVQLADGYLYALIGQSLAIFDVSDPARPVWLREIPSVTDFKVEGVKLYTVGDGFFRIHHLSNAGEPVEVVSYPTYASYFDVAANRAYLVTLYPTRLFELDITNELMPFEMRNVAFSIVGQGISVRDGIAYFIRSTTSIEGTTRYAQVDVYDLAADVTFIESLNADLLGDGGYDFLDESRSHANGLEVQIERSEIIHVKSAQGDVLSSLFTKEQLAGLAVDGDHAYVAYRHNGLYVLDISVPSAPRTQLQKAGEAKVINYLFYAGQYVMLYLGSWYDNPELVLLDATAEGVPVIARQLRDLASEVYSDETATVWLEKGYFDDYYTLCIGSDAGIYARLLYPYELPVFIEGENADVIDFGYTDGMVYIVSRRDSQHSLHIYDVRNPSYIPPSTTYVMEANDPFAGAYYGGLCFYQGQVASSFYRFVSDGNDLSTLPLPAGEHPFWPGTRFDGHWGFRQIDDERVEIWDVLDASLPVKLGTVGVRYLHTVRVEGGYAYLAQADGRLIVVELEPGVDTDQDGLPDNWENAYLGTLAFGGTEVAGPHHLPLLVAYGVGAKRSNVGEELIRLSTSDDQQHLTLSFARQDDQTLAYRVEGSPDGHTWSEVWNDDAMSAAAGPVTIVDTARLADGPRFLRLVVARFGLPMD